MDIYVVKAREIEVRRGGVLVTYHQKIRKSAKTLLNERSMSCKSSELRHRGQNRCDRRVFLLRTRVLLYGKRQNSVYKLHGRRRTVQILSIQRK